MFVYVLAGSDFVKPSVNLCTFILVFHTFIFSIVVIHYLSALQVVKSCFVPALIGHAIDDDFIRPHHSDRILEAYMVSMSFI